MMPRALLKAMFWLSAGSVVFLAVVPGPLGQVIASGFQRHFLAFLILPALARATWPRVDAIKLLLAFAAFGAAIEGAQQAMQLGREAEWSDWLNDLYATMLSLAVTQPFVHGWRANAAGAGGDTPKLRLAGQPEP
jgi:hypothetical protein